GLGCGRHLESEPCPRTNPPVRLERDPLGRQVTGRDEPLDVAPGQPGDVGYISIDTQRANDLRHTHLVYRARRAPLSHRQEFLPIPAPTPPGAQPLVPRAAARSRERPAGESRS